MRTPILILVFAVVVLVGASAVGGAVQAGPDTREEYLETLDGMNNLDVYDQYSELDTVQTQALAAVQTGTFDAETAEKVDTIITIIRTFERAQSQLKTGEYSDGIRTAERIEGQIQTLQSFDESLAALGRTAVTRYYEVVGNRLTRLAAQAPTTAEQIEIRDLAAQAQRSANNPEQAAELTRQADYLRAELAADTDQIAEAEATMERLSTACSGCNGVITAISKNGLNVFNNYALAVQAESALTDAAERAAVNGLNGREAVLLEQAARSSRFSSATGLAATLLIVGYAVFVGSVSTIVLHRICRWQQTYEMARNDSVVVAGDRDG